MDSVMLAFLVDVLKEHGVNVGLVGGQISSIAKDDPHIHFSRDETDGTFSYLDFEDNDFRISYVEKIGNGKVKGTLKMAHGRTMHTSVIYTNILAN